MILVGMLTMPPNLRLVMNFSTHENEHRTIKIIIIFIY